ncbi:MAG: hypothetical protein EHM64_07265 [Ignavibacteriae bacterium]|nr:MAG: hypothetical protein EHM64_07265 [Ignavibacteriota bacterium]
MKKQALNILWLIFLLPGCQTGNIDHNTIQGSAAAGYEKEVWKQSDTSYIKLKSGTIKMLVDNKEEGGNYISYSYKNKLPGLPFFVFAVQYYEGSQVLLINGANGNEYFINNEPRLSPDNKFLVTASLDLEAHYNPNELNVWQIESDTLKLVFSIKPSDWGPSDPMWVSNRSLNFNKNIFNRNGESTLKEMHIIELKDSSWEIK